MALGAVEIVVLQWRGSGALLLGSAAGKSGFVRHLPAVQGVRCERERGGERDPGLSLSTRCTPFTQRGEGGGGNGVKGRQPLIVMERENAVCTVAGAVRVHARLRARTHARTHTRSLLSLPLCLSAKSFVCLCCRVLGGM